MSVEAFSRLGRSASVGKRPGETISVDHVINRSHRTRTALTNQEATQCRATERGKQCSIIEFTTCASGALIRLSVPDADPTLLACESALQRGIRVSTSSGASHQYKQRGKVTELRWKSKKESLRIAVFIFHLALTAAAMSSTKQPANEPPALVSASAR